MPLEVHPFQESDLRAFALLQIAAFQGGMAAIIFPGPITEENIQKMVDKSVKSFRTEPDCHWLKVVDTDLNDRMVAGAKWRINETERTEEQMNSLLPQPTEEDKKKPTLVEFYEHLAWSRRTYLGTKPSYLLHLLVTHPDHHRRGAGAKLVNWGIEKADKAGLPCYLEASSVGRPLYARLGFEPVFERTFNLSKYGVSETESNTVMIRPSQIRQ